MPDDRGDYLRKGEVQNRDQIERKTLEVWRERGKGGRTGKGGFISRTMSSLEKKRKEVSFPRVKPIKQTGHLYLGGDVRGGGRKTQAKISGLAQSKVFLQSGRKTKV